MAGQLAREAILERTSRGRFLGKFGAGYAYARKKNQYPLFSPAPGEIIRDAAVHAEKSAILSRIRIPKVYNKKAGPYGLFPRGYWQLRKRAGLPAERVDLSFTGSMLQDVKVKAWIRTARRTKNTISYSIHYEFSMINGGSERLREIFEGRGMKFLGLSKNEARDISKIVAHDMIGQKPTRGLRTNIFQQ